MSWIRSASNQRRPSVLTLKAASRAKTRERAASASASKRRSALAFSLPSAERAAGELRRAGFRDVVADRRLLEHAFTVDGYISFLTEFDEQSLFDEMGRAERRRFLQEFRERLTGLRPDELTFRVPIVYASGRRSNG